MDFVRLANPAVLALAVPVWMAVWYAALRPGRRGGAAFRASLGTLATGLLILALAGPSVRLGRRGVCPVVLARDDSPSMRAAIGEGDPGPPLAPWLAALPPARTQVVPFADRDGTDIDAGLRKAAAALPEGAGLILLWTDARETRGDAAVAAARLAAAGIRVHAIAPRGVVKDAAVASLEPHPLPTPGRPFPLTVRVVANSLAAVALRLERASVDGTSARRWTRTVRVSPEAGAIVRFRDGPLPAGRYRYDLSLRAEDDACAENNRARCTLTVGGHRAVYYVHRGETPGPLAEALARLVGPDMHISTRPLAEGLPPPDASAVILENVPAWALGRRGIERFARAVTAGGLGLLVLGGDTAFSAGAYADSPLENLLPVSSRMAERPRVNLVLVLDASGSMNETVEGTQKLALAKRAALSLRPVLAAEDRIGIVAFAGEARVVAPLASVDRWPALRRGLLALRAGGGTRITGAIETAVEQFPAPEPALDRTVRHLLVLSDGRSEDFAVDRLASLAGSHNVSISAVATGTGARTDLLGRLASETGGRLYPGADPARLTDTFLTEMTRARGARLRRVARTVRWARGEPVWRGALPPLPSVPAFNLTRPKEGADVHWVAEPRDGQDAREPLLATWHRGLGKAAAMPWPAGSPPDVWLTGAPARDRFAPLLAWLARTQGPPDWSARLRREDGAWRLRVEQTPEALAAPPRNFLAEVLTGEDTPPPAVRLEQVKPGIYEAALPGLDARGGMVVVRHEGTRRAVRLPVPALPPSELLRVGVDDDRLNAITTAGRGRVHTTPATLRKAVAEIEVAGYHPAGIYLVWPAAVVILLLAAGRLLGRA